MQQREILKFLMKRSKTGKTSNQSIMETRCGRIMRNSINTPRIGLGANQVVAEMAMEALSSFMFKLFNCSNNENLTIMPEDVVALADRSNGEFGFSVLTDLELRKVTVPKKDLSEKEREQLKTLSEKTRKRKAADPTDDEVDFKTKKQKLDDKLKEEIAKTKAEINNEDDSDFGNMTKMVQRLKKLKKIHEKETMKLFKKHKQELSKDEQLALLVNQKRHNKKKNKHS